MFLSTIAISLFNGPLVYFYFFGQFFACCTLDLRYMDTDYLREHKAQSKTNMVPSLKMLALRAHKARHKWTLLGTRLFDAAMDNRSVARFGRMRATELSHVSPILRSAF